MVLWLIGISGAGKTTLAQMLEQYFLRKKRSVYILDGDLIREFYDNDLGYSQVDREANIKRIMLAAYVLDQNEIITIVANISPFEYLRQFARRKIKDYVQIYLQKDIHISMRNDIKGIYKNHLLKTDLVGIDVPFEEPLDNELILSVDHMTKEKAYSLIIEFINKKYGV